MKTLNILARTPMNYQISLDEARKDTNRARQARRSKTTIVQGYIDLGKEVGYSKITVTGLCKYLGISVGRFYHYFNSLDDLGHQVYYSLDESVNTWMKEYGPEFNELSAKERLIIFAGWFARHNVESGLEHTKKIYSGSNTSMTVRKEMTTHVELFVKDFWEEAKLQNSCTLDELVRYIRVIMRGVMLDWAMHDGCYDAEDSMKNIISCAIDGVLQKAEEKPLFYKDSPNM